MTNAEIEALLAQVIATVREERDAAFSRLEARIKSLETQVDAERAIRELSERAMAQIDRHGAELSRVEAELALLTTSPPLGLLRQ